MVTSVCLSRACYYYEKECRQAAGARLSPRNQIVAAFLVHGAAQEVLRESIDRSEEACPCVRASVRFVRSKTGEKIGSRQKNPDTCTKSDTKEVRHEQLEVGAMSCSVLGLLRVRSSFYVRSSINCADFLSCFEFLIVIYSQCNPVLEDRPWKSFLRSNRPKTLLLRQSKDCTAIVVKSELSV